EEFGECKTSFPFSCDGYAKRFANDEKILCRTTRHKTANGTFTVVKECIADSAHHATFPRKSYELAEECDVLDLNGVEVAYCLCRSANLCNGAPIVGQFSAFEEKYPELFEPEPTAGAASDRLSSQQQQQPSRELSQSAGDGDGGEELGEEPSLRPSQHRASGEEAAAESTDFQMSTFHGPIVDGNVHFTAPPQSGSTAAQIPTTEENNPFVAPPTPPGDDGTVHQNICLCSTAQCNGPSVGERMHIANHQNGSSPTLTMPTAASTSANTQTTKLMLEEQFLSEPLNCAVCLDVELRNSESDCRSAHSQNCAHQMRAEKAFCLTRQTQNGKDAFIVEKSCVTKRQFYQQFPEELQKRGIDDVPLGCDATYDGGRKQRKKRQQNAAIAGSSGQTDEFGTKNANRNIKRLNAENKYATSSKVFGRIGRATDGKKRKFLCRLPFGPQLANFGPQLANFGSQLANFGSQLANFGRADPFGPNRRFDADSDTGSTAKMEAEQRQGQNPQKNFIEIIID
uniref:RING-type domain-containing protein n=1 Tax=Globodera pallida TaxID=36090 RepID=A0A183C759_GLOPA